MQLILVPIDLNFCDEQEIKFKYFEKINDFSKKFKFKFGHPIVVGVSQLVNIYINSAKIGSIGFHQLNYQKEEEELGSMAVNDLQMEQQHFCFRRGGRYRRYTLPRSFNGSKGYSKG